MWGDGLIESSLTAVELNRGVFVIVRPRHEAETWSSFFYCPCKCFHSVSTIHTWEV